VPTVRYVPAPTAPNVFVYNSQYWAFANGGWYVSSAYNGPWIVVQPQFVPRPVLLVPVQYYHGPPGHWQKWERGRPPHWQDGWGGGGAGGGGRGGGEGGVTRGKTRGGGGGGAGPGAAREGGGPPGGRPPPQFSDPGKPSAGDGSPYLDRPYGRLLRHAVGTLV